MKYHDIVIKFTLNEEEYKQYDKNIDRAIVLILPWGKDFEVYEKDYDEEE